MVQSKIHHLEYFGNWFNMVVVFGYDIDTGIKWEGMKMAYKRKTRDLWEIEGYYQGWEVVTVEDTIKEAKQRLKEYRENETGTMFKMVKRHIKKLD